MNQPMKRIGKHLQAGWHFLLHDLWDVELTGLPAVRRQLVKFLRAVNLVWHGFKEDECPLHAASLTYTSLMAIVPVLALALALARVFGGEELARTQLKKLVGSQFGVSSVATNAIEVTPRATVEPTPSETVGPLTPVAGMPPPAATNIVALAPTGISNAVVVAAAGHGAATGPEATGETFDIGEKLEGLIDTSFDRIAEINFAALGGIGLALLVWMVISVLGRVESSFNRVWGVSKGRALWRKFTDYLSVLLILPFLVLAATSIPAAELVTRFVAGDARETVQTLMEAPILRKTAVLLLTSLVFMFIIRFMPNTRVRLVPGFTGGVVTAILFMVWLRLCATFQVGVARSSALYGGFAIVPILLAWVYVSWQVVLFGAEVAFAFQNCGSFRMEQGARRASVHSRMMLAVALVAEIVRTMRRPGTLFNASEFARDKQLSVRLMNDVMTELVDAGIVAEVADQRSCYVLRRDPSTLTAGDVVGAMMNAGVPPAQLGLNRLDERVRKLGGAWQDEMDRSLPQSVSDLVDG